MLFLNMALLFGMIAVGVPIIIHLLNRRSARFVNWGAIQFLLDSLVSRKRRILMEEVLLLGSRCLLLALLVTAMARPFVPADSRTPWLVVLPMILLAIVMFGVSFALWDYARWRRYMLLGAGVLIILAGMLVGVERWLNLRRFGGLGQRDVALIIDGSMSMSLAVEGTSNLDRAKAEAAKIVEKSNRRAAFSLIVGGSTPAVKIPSPIADRKEVLAAIEEIKPVYGTMKILDALGAAAVTLSQGSSASKIIIIITDGQNNGWETESPSRWDFVAKTFERLPSKPQILFRKLKAPKDIRNVGIADISFSRDVIGIDREVTINVRVENTGTEGITPTSVKLNVDGKELTDNTIGQLAAGASETIKFPYHFIKEGSHIVTARVVASDELAWDDAYSVVANVVGKLRVLIVDGNPAGRFLERGAAFSALALAPSSNTVAAVKQQSARSGGFLIEPELIDAPGIGSLKNFDNYNVILLANVPRLPSDVADAISRFVASGGGLLIAPGDRCVPDFYNNWMADKAQPVMPAQMDKRVLIKEGEDDVKASLSTFTHRSLKLVADASHSDIGSVVFTSYWRIKEQQLDRNISVGGRFNNGDPLLMERKLGNGFIIMTACSFDIRGSSLVTRHSFLPFAHEMIYYLANPGGVKLNVEPARKLTLRLSGGRMPGSGTPQNGLRGDYYGGMNFEKLLVSRLDPRLDFEWNNVSPGQGIPRENLSVRWTGQIRADKSELYTVYGASDDGIRILIDGKKIVEFWQGRGAAESTGTFQFQTGKLYDIQVDYFQGGGNAGIWLRWSSPSTPKEIVPANNLSVVFDTAGASVQTDAEVVGPYGEKMKGKIIGGKEGNVAIIEGDVLPGLYSLHIPSANSAQFVSVAGQDGNVPFVVVREIEESKFNELDSTDTDLVKKYVDLMEAESADNVLQVLAGKTFGQELWRHLAVGALLLVLIEILLTRWIATQRRFGQAIKVEFEELGKPSVAFHEQLDKLRAQTAEEAPAPPVGAGKS